MKKIALHHIGGRNGSRPFPILDQFEQDFVSVLYDADASCLDEAEAKNKELKSQLFVLPYCVAKNCGPVEFNLNTDPFTSSLLEKNPAYDHYCLDSADSRGEVIDYRFGETLKTVRKIPLEAVSLDHLFFEKKISAPLPDFLSLDTQGSEYDIIQGGGQTLKHVLGLICEVEFLPLYKGQKLFGEIHADLSQRDFDFIDFVHIGRLRPAVTPIGLRGSGQIYFGDALFLRRPQSLMSITDSHLRMVQLKKLAFIAVVYTQLELALECFKLLESFPQALYTEGDPEYFKFLKEFKSEIPLYSQYPKSFSPPVASNAQETKAAATSNIWRRSLSEIKAWLKGHPVLFQLAVKIYGKKRALSHSMHLLLNWSKRRPFGVETVLARYGLDDAAQEVRKKRLAYL